MEQTSQKINVLIVGATGQLGSLITRHCLEQPKLLVSILVRDPSKCKELTTQVEKSGGKVLKGDISKPDTIRGATKGMHTVISAINSDDPSIFLKPQMNLVDECVKSGVQRFVPSNFGINYSKLSREEVSPFPPTKAKLEFDEYLSKQSIKVLDFWPGIFIERFFYLQSQGLCYWGETEQKYCFTSYEDMAKVVAMAVSNRDLTGHIVFVSNELTMRQVADTYNKVRATNLSPKRMGSREELRKQYEEKTKSGDTKGSLMSGIQLVISDPKSMFEKNNNNEFRDVKPTSFEEYLRQHPEVRLT
jgi:nucleoside-diphosphate-sugar epimerase